MFQVPTSNASKGWGVKGDLLLDKPITSICMYTYRYVHLLKVTWFDVVYFFGNLAILLFRIIIFKVGILVPVKYLVIGEIYHFYFLYEEIPLGTQNAKFRLRSSMRDFTDAHIHAYMYSTYTPCLQSSSLVVAASQHHNETAQQLLAVLVDEGAEPVQAQDYGVQEEGQVGRPVHLLQLHHEL